MAAVSTLPTPAVPPPGKDLKSEGASTEQKGKSTWCPCVNDPTVTLFYNKGSVGGEGDKSAESAANGGREEEVPVDESLFTEQEDVPGNQDDNMAAVDEVQVDESLFDIENLDIDDDPSLAQTDATWRQTGLFI